MTIKVDQLVGILRYFNATNSFSADRKTKFQQRKKKSSFYSNEQFQN